MVKGRTIVLYYCLYSGLQGVVDVWQSEDHHTTYGAVINEDGFATLRVLAMYEVKFMNVLKSHPLP